jgi:tRNA-5-taurinomethyluridine 2-sulfurtransferase
VHVCRYVVRKNPRMNAVYVSLKYFSEDKIRDSFTCGSFNWIGGAPPLQMTFAGRPKAASTKNKLLEVPHAEEHSYRSDGESFPDGDSRLFVKVRHGPRMYMCKEFTLSEDGSRAQVKLHENDQGLAAGQYAVFYQRGECLGCGVIL